MRLASQSLAEVEKRRWEQNRTEHSGAEHTGLLSGTLSGTLVGSKQLAAQVGN